MGLIRKMIHYRILALACELGIIAFKPNENCFLNASKCRQNAVLSADFDSKNDFFGLFLWVFG
jgi:hypothetical protein